MTLEQFVRDALGRGCAQQTVGLARDPDGGLVMTLRAQASTSRFRVEGNRLVFVSSITWKPAAIVRQRAAARLTDVTGEPITGP